MELTLTHHMVDDIAEQDEVMNFFRSQFHLVANCNVDPCGKVMRYRLKSTIAASVWEISAKKIIKAHNLPLEAKLDVWQTGSLVHEVSLVISYKL
jgi:hypothetical protein